VITESSSPATNFDEGIHDPLEIGRYKVQRRLGQGAMGLVYLAFDPLLMRLVAIKIMRNARGDNSQVQARFQREAVISAKLNHPHIITVFDVGDDRACGPFMAMEYVDGASLADLIKEPLPIETGLRLLLQTMSALSASEAAGIAHRDIKPHNILVSREWRAKLMDFGIAHADETHLTQAGLIIGTPLYTAPEVLTGTEASPVSDRYSFAVTAFEVITGTLPYQAKSVGTLVYRIVHSEPEFPESLSPALREIFLKALAKRPENRYPDSFQLLEALIAALDLTEDHRIRLQSHLTQLRAVAQQAPMDERSLAASRATTQILAPTVMFDTAGNYPEELDLNEAPASTNTDQPTLLPVAYPTQILPPNTLDPTAEIQAAAISENAAHTMVLPVMPVEIEAPVETVISQPATMVIPRVEIEPVPESKLESRPASKHEASLETKPGLQPEIQAAAIPENAAHTMVLPVMPVEIEAPVETVTVQPATMVIPRVEIEPAHTTEPEIPSAPIPEHAAPTVLLPPLPADVTSEAPAAPEARFQTQPIPTQTPEVLIEARIEPQPAAVAAPARKKRTGLILTTVTIFLLVGGAAAVYFMPRMRHKQVLPASCTIPNLTSNPEGASVYLDGKLLGTAPLYEVTYTGAGHHIRVEHVGYQPETRLLDARESSMHFQLKPIGQRISITSDPSGAEVLMDGQPVGTTPLKDFVLPEGSHEITLRHEGYTEWQATVDPDLPLPEPIRLNPIARRKRR